MEKGQIIEITVDDMLDDGRAFGRYEGCAVFMSCDDTQRSDSRDRNSACRSAVPGDTVSAKVTKAKQNSAEAVVTSIVKPSTERIKAECPYFGRCGGCTMQELSYDTQKRLKTAQVRAKLERLGGIEDPKVNAMTGADTLKYYRNKAVFAVGPHGEVGFKMAKSHYVMDIDDCLLQSDAAMVCADALRAFLREHPAAKGKGAQITGMTVKTAFGTGEVMVVLETGTADGQNNRNDRSRSRNGDGARSAAADPFEIEGVETLIAMFDDAVYSLDFEDGSSNIIDEQPGAESYNAREDGQFRYSLESVAVVYKGKCRIAAGMPTITDEIITDRGSTIRYEISPQSFYQVNPEQMARLYDKAAEYAGLAGDTQAQPGQARTILDLYCGAGTIGIWLLDTLRNTDEEAFANTRVIGIESVKPAVIDANRNSVINGLVNTRYICGKAEEELPGIMGLAKLYKWNEVNERVPREPEFRIGRAGYNAGFKGELTAEKIDVAVLDPPRAGCAEPLLGAVVQAAPDRIVYVSCDPGTLARDIKYLCANGYEFVEATPVDQFPWTSSIEVVAKLQKEQKCN